MSEILRGYGINADGVMKPIGTPLAADSERLGGNEANLYALKTDTVANTEKLGEQLPEYYAKQEDLTTLTGTDAQTAKNSDSLGGISAANYVLRQELDGITFLNEKEVSGDVLSFDDGVALPPISLVTNIEPLQAGSGDPSLTNVRPISGWDEVTVTRIGKNLIPMYTANTMITDTSEYSSPMVELHGALPLNVPLSSRCFFSDGTELNTAGAVLVLYRADGTKLGDYGFAGAKITLTERVEAYRVYMNSNGATQHYGKTIANVQLTVGDATGIVPYQEETFTVTPSETIYGGTMDWDTGVLTVGWEAFTVDGSNIKAAIVWMEGDLPYAVVMPSRFGINTSFENTDYLLTDKFKTIPTMASGNCYITNYGQFICFGSYDITLTTTDLFNTWFQANPVTVCYKLADPYTIQFDLEQLKLLRGNNTVWSNCGSTDMVYIQNAQMYINSLEQQVAALSAAVLNL